MRIKRFLPDAVVLAVLVAVSVGVGTVFLGQWAGLVGVEGNAGTWFLEPSLMLACGKGFVLTDPGDQPPALATFLNQQCDAFSRADLPLDQPLTRPASYHYRHKYVIYLVGLIWRVFGISWRAVEVLLVILLCITSALVYGIFRLGTGRVIALLGGILYVTSPWGLAILPMLRDFGKAPFILACLLMLGVLARRPASRPVFLGLSALLGAVIGIGLGFRMDVVICLPASLCVVALCPRRRPGAGSASRIYLGERAGAIALLLASFALASAPLMRAYEDSGCPSHDALMGFDTSHENSLGIDQASYERTTSFRDDFVLAATTCYARRVHGHRDVIRNWTAAYDDAGRKRLWDMARQFPADMLTRAYAAVSWTLGYSGLDAPTTSFNDRFLERLSTLRAPLTVFLWRCRFLIAAAVLVGMAAHGLRRACLTLFLVLYFGGYICLQYEDRHFFHLAFVPVWFAGVAVDRVARLGGALAHAAGRREAGRLLLQPRQWWSPAIRRALVFSVGVSVVLFGPLYTLRAYQAHAVGKLADLYAAADLEPLDTDVQSVEEWVYFRPAGPLACQAFAFFGPPPSPGLVSWPLPGDYLMAEFEPAPEARVFRLMYETDNYSVDFSSTQRVRPSGEKGQGTSRFFFPVYECMGAYPLAPWSRFAGIALPKEHAGEFKGLFRVGNAAEFRLWPALWLPADRSLFRPCQRLRPGGSFIQPTWWPGEPASLAWWSMTFLDVEDRKHDQPDAGIAPLREALDQDPGNVALHIAVAEELKAMGEIDAAIDAYRAAIRATPLFFVAYDALDALVGERDGLEGRIAQWRRLVSDLPECAHPYFCLGRALAEQGEISAAVDAYREAGRLNPITPAVPWAIGDLLGTQGQWEEALEAYRQAAQLSPLDVAAIDIGIADALVALHDTPEAVRVCRAALARDPANEALHARLAGALEADGRLGEAVEACRELVRLDPWVLKSHERLVALLCKQGDTAGALDALDQVRVFFPDDASIAMAISESEQKRAASLEQQGDVDGALEACRAAIDLAPDSFELYSSTYKLLSGKTDAGRQEDEWHSIAEAHPGSPHAWFYLGVVLEGTDDVDQAVDAYRRAIEIDPSGWASYERLGTVLDKAGDWAGALDAYRQARRLCPDNPLLRAKLAELHERHAATLEQQGDTDGALDAYRTAIDLEPDSFALYESIYTLLSAKTDAGKQKDEWGSIIEAHPVSPHAWFYLGIALQANGDFDGAIEAYRRGVEIEPSSSFTQRNLGVLLAREGDHQAAIEPLQAAIDAHPEFADAQVALLEALVETEQLDLAREQLRTCRERDVTVPAALVDALGGQ